VSSGVRLRTFRKIVLTFSELKCKPSKEAEQHYHTTFNLVKPYVSHFKRVIYNEYLIKYVIKNPVLCGMVSVV
jgi:hypothetical protein